MGHLSQIFSGRITPLPAGFKWSTTLRPHLEELELFTLQ